MARGKTIKINFYNVSYKNPIYSQIASFIYDELQEWEREIWWVLASFVHNGRKPHPMQRRKKGPRWGIHLFFPSHPSCLELTLLKENVFIALWRFPSMRPLNFLSKILKLHTQAQKYKSNFSGPCFLVMSTIFPSERLFSGGGSGAI